MTIQTVKFSEFANGGDLEPNQTTVGLDNTNTVNTRFSNPFPLLAPGTTADRPAPAPNMYYRLRFNTTDLAYEYYEPLSSTWIQLEDSASVLPILASHLPGEGASLIGLQNQSGVLNKFVQDMANATLLAQTDNGTLTNGQFLSALASGFVSVTTATGVLNSRTYSGTANQIDLTNGDGSGAPVWSLPTTLIAPGTFQVGNLFFNTNTISSTNTDGRINLIPNGNGVVHVSDNTLEVHHPGQFLTSIDQTTEGLLLSAGNMNSINTFSQPLLFGSTDSDFTSANPKTLAAIAGEVIQAATSDTSGALGLAFFVTADNPGAAPTLTRMAQLAILSGFPTFALDGAAGFPSRVRLQGDTSISTNTVRLQAPSNVTQAHSIIIPPAAPTVNGQVATTTTTGIQTWSGIPIAATSGITFAGGSGILNYYDEALPWTPAITFATPGDLSVVYTTQAGTLTREGNRVTIRCQIAFTPTYTTAAGAFRITNLPYVVRSGMPFGAMTGTIVAQGGNFSWPAGTTMIVVAAQSGKTYCEIRGFATAMSTATVTTTEVPSGLAQNITFNLTYFT